MTPKSRVARLWFVRTEGFPSTRTLSAQPSTVPGKLEQMIILLNLRGRHIGRSFSSSRESWVAALHTVIRGPRLLPLASTHTGCCLGDFSGPATGDYSNPGPMAAPNCKGGWERKARREENLIGDSPISMSRVS